MTDKDKIRSDRKVKSSVNRQGMTEDEANQRPESQLEQRAKKKNTKI
ncbi:small, acid-soluble spore protein L [Virgibacillus siamensis]|nr:small, acid-soluble spore protein L [Virgibacillus siamensis]